MTSRIFRHDGLPERQLYDRVRGKLNGSELPLRLSKSRAGVEISAAINSGDDVALKLQPLVFLSRYSHLAWSNVEFEHEQKNSDSPTSLQALRRQFGDVCGDPDWTHQLLRISTDQVSPGKADDLRVLIAIGEADSEENCAAKLQSVGCVCSIYRIARLDADQYIQKRVLRSAMAPADLPAFLGHHDVIVTTDRVAAMEALLCGLALLVPDDIKNLSNETEVKSALRHPEACIEELEIFFSTRLITVSMPRIISLIRDAGTKRVDLPSTVWRYADDKLPVWQTKPGRMERIEKKMRKLLRDPVLFFADSRHPIIRWPDRLRSVLNYPWRRNSE